MTPINHPALEDLHQRTTAMLTTIDDTPLERDHLHYPHHYEELRRIADAAPEEVLRLAHGEILERHAADWRSCLDLSV